MSDSKNQSANKVEKLNVALNDNALLFTKTSNRIYTLSVDHNHNGTLQGIINFVYLNKKFTCALKLSSAHVNLKVQSPYLLTPTGLLELSSKSSAAENLYLNEFGIITQQGDEAIGWLIIDIINHYNDSRLKPKTSKLFRAELN
jgi:hypothetical protein